MNNGWLQSELRTFFQRYKLNNSLNLIKEKTIQVCKKSNKKYIILNKPKEGCQNCWELLMP